MLQHFELNELATLPLENKVSVGLGERRLIAAVLRQTLDDLIEHQDRADPNSRRIFDTASTWIFSNVQRDREDHLSFTRTCDLLGLEPSYVRGLVRRLLRGPCRVGPRAA